MPAVLPLVAVASIWTWMYNPTAGSVNAILQAISLGSLQQVWLGQDNTAFGAILVAGIWVRTGFPMLIYLAALQGIPNELYEASALDGASEALSLLFSLPLKEFLQRGPDIPPQSAPAQ